MNQTIVQGQIFYIQPRTTFRVVRQLQPRIQPTHIFSQKTPVPQTKPPLQELLAETKQAVLFNNTVYVPAINKKNATATILGKPAEICEDIQWFLEEQQVDTFWKKLTDAYLQWYQPKKETQTNPEGKQTKEQKIILPNTYFTQKNTQLLVPVEPRPNVDFSVGRHFFSKQPIRIPQTTFWNQHYQKKILPQKEFDRDHTQHNQNCRLKKIDEQTIVLSTKQPAHEVEAESQKYYFDATQLTLRITHTQDECLITQFPRARKGYEHFFVFSNGSICYNGSSRFNKINLHQNSWMPKNEETATKLATAMHYAKNVLMFGYTPDCAPVHYPRSLQHKTQWYTKQI
ncbi:MAG: hypothetical protein ACI8Y7_000094 [Candidatus Woesearchaeota archaeon]|jgi:hypothetical protein